MDKIIPIFPCYNIKEQVAFYEALGFEIVSLTTHPSPYAVVRYGDIELQFYVSRGLAPADNPTMCFLKTADVDSLCEAFTSNLKKATGKIPRSGFPRITKVRELATDRRFTLSDVSGNTIYAATIKSSFAVENFFRTIINPKHAQKFSVLYDFVYSKEDFKLAKTFTTKIKGIYEELNDLDKAKFLLIQNEICLEMGESFDSRELKRLIDGNEAKAEWQKIAQKFKEQTNK